MSTAFCRWALPLKRHSIFTQQTTFLNIFFCISRENKTWYFMWIVVCLADDSHVTFSRKKYFRISSAAVVSGTLKPRMVLLCILTRFLEELFQILLDRYAGHLLKHRFSGKGFLFKRAGKIKTRRSFCGMSLPILLLVSKQRNRIAKASLWLHVSTDRAGPPRWPYTL